MFLALCIWILLWTVSHVWIDLNRFKSIGEWIALANRMLETCWFIFEGFSIRLYVWTTKIIFMYYEIMGKHIKLATYTNTNQFIVITKPTYLENEITAYTFTVWIDYIILLSACLFSVPLMIIIWTFCKRNIKYYISLYVVKHEHIQ